MAGGPGAKGSESNHRRWVPPVPRCRGPGNPPPFTPPVLLSHPQNPAPHPRRPRSAGHAWEPPKKSSPRFAENYPHFAHNKNRVKAGSGLKASGRGHPLPPLIIFLFHRKFADYFAAGLPTSSPRAKSAAPKLMSRVSPVASLAGRVSMPLKLLPHAMSAAVRLSVFILRCARHALFLPPRGLNHVIR